MRESIVIGLIIGFVFFAGGAVLTALAIKQPTNSALWDIVLWSDIAIMLASIATLLLFISSQLNGRPFLWPMLLVNLGICVIVGGFVLHYSP